MSSKTIDILFGVAGQALYFDAPEGRPSSIVSSDVFENTTGDDGTEEAATSGAAAVEVAPVTTFDDDSGEREADPTKCWLASTASIAVGRSYLATNALGQSDRVEVVGVAAGDHVLAREPLANVYATGDAFVTTRVTQAIDATWVADTANLSDEFDPNAKFRWRLVYVVAGVTHAHDVYFDLLRYAGRHDVGPGDVDLIFPGWVDRLPTNYRDDSGRALIDRAYQDLKFDLFNLKTADQSIRNREVVNELVALRAGYLVDSTDLNGKRYSDRLTQLIAMANTSVSSSSSGAAMLPSPVRPWRR